ncbi:MAG: LysR family transcriptional regulator [Marinobacter sp.]|uniref:LysR family transcriptional regulator n=1 Tax=Marinobacter sp. TaxID=50741 RepID=UPI0034A04B3E
MEDALHKITLRQLQIFLIAAQTSSFIRAAEILSLTPPAVSMQMSSLGEELGAPLFEKRGRNLVLTVAGETLIPYAERITQTLGDANEAIGALKGVQRSTVKVGMVTTSRNFGPHLVARFQAEHRDTKLDIVIANRRSIIEKLEHQQVDVALMGRSPRRIQVESVPFADHPYVVIANANHPLAGKSSIDPKELGTETFLVREKGSGTRMVLERFLEDSGLSVPRIQEIGGTENIKQAVMANMGVAVISGHTIHLERQLGLLSVLDVQGMPQIRTWFAVHLKGRELSEAATRFEQFVKEQGPQFMAEFFGESATQTPSKGAK